MFLNSLLEKFSSGRYRSPKCRTALGTDSFFRHLILDIRIYFLIHQKSDFTFIILFMFLFGIPYSCSSINTQSCSVPCDQINQPTKPPRNTSKLVSQRSIHCALVHIYYSSVVVITHTLIGEHNSYLVFICSFACTARSISDLHRKLVGLIKPSQQYNVASV